MACSRDAAEGRLEEEEEEEGQSLLPGTPSDGSTRSSPGSRAATCGARLLAATGVVGLVGAAASLAVGRRSRRTLRSGGGGAAGLIELQELVPYVDPEAYALAWNSPGGACLTNPFPVAEEGSEIVMTACTGGQEQQFLVAGELLQYGPQRQLCLEALPALDGFSAELTGYSLVLHTCSPYVGLQKWYLDAGQLRLRAAPELCVAEPVGSIESGRLAACVAAAPVPAAPMAAAVAGTCASYGCVGYSPSNVCQCNPGCASHGSCCPDFLEWCSSGGGSEAAVAAAAFVPAAAPSAAFVQVPGAACASLGEDCRSAQCCSMQGTQCYVKTQDWAGCTGSCDPALGWECTPLGERAPMITAGTWPGEECSFSKFCAVAGQQCIRKDAMSAFCADGPLPGWSGEVLGGSRQEYGVQPAAGATAGVVLFCFMAVLPGSAEEALRHEAERRQASIFACDLHAVYSSSPSQFIQDGGDSGTWTSFANTDSFVKVWQEVVDDGRWSQADWIVKVDPDTVFLPDRLRSHLQGLRPPAGKPIYIKNCAVEFGFLGAIEIISRVAMNDYSQSFAECRRVMPGTSGEDGFLKGCLDALGAGYMTDASILRTPSEQNACTDGSRVAFHPRKDPGSWGTCLGEATR